MTTSSKSSFSLIEGSSVNDLLGEAENYAFKRNQIVADMKNIINVMTKICTCDFNDNGEFLLEDFIVREILSNSAQYYATDKSGHRIFMVGHSQGLLSESLFFKANDVYFQSNHKAYFEDDALDLEGLWNYDLINIEDLKNNNSFQKCLIYVDLDEQKLKTHALPFHNYDSWMRDDLILMQCGGEEEREKLAKLYFRPNNAKFRKEKLIKNNNFFEDEFFCVPRGESLVFSTNILGIFGQRKIGDLSRMLIVPSYLISEENLVELDSLIHK